MKKKKWIIGILCLAMATVFAGSGRADQGVSEIKETQSDKTAANRGETLVVIQSTPGDKPNIRIGKESDVRRGDVKLGSGVHKNGVVVSITDQKGGVNVSLGDQNRAALDAVRIENSSLNGHVVNHVAGKGSVNITTGHPGSAARMGAISVENNAMRGTIVNRSVTDRGVNMAIGNDSESRANSVVVE